MSTLPATPGTCHNAILLLFYFSSLSFLLSHPGLLHPMASSLSMVSCSFPLLPESYLEEDPPPTDAFPLTPKVIWVVAEQGFRPWPLTCGPGLFHMPHPLHGAFIRLGSLGTPWRDEARDREAEMRSLVLMEEVQARQDSGWWQSLREVIRPSLLIPEDTEMHILILHCTAFLAVRPGSRFTLAGDRWGLLNWCQFRYSCPYQNKMCISACVYAGKFEDRQWWRDLQPSGTGGQSCWPHRGTCGQRGEAAIIFSVTQEQDWSPYTHPAGG